MRVVSIATTLSTTENGAKIKHIAVNEAATPINCPGFESQ
jgi:hypothetical protein